jgi:hypothetical protein
MAVAAPSRDRKPRRSEPVARWEEAMPADNKGANPIHEKKDDAGQEKGDKGHQADEKDQDRQTHHPGGPNGSGRGEGHRRRTGGNPDASN